MSHLREKLKDLLPRLYDQEKQPDPIVYAKFLVLQTFEWVRQFSFARHGAHNAVLA